jgi:hypothetical protein
MTTIRTIMTLQLFTKPMQTLMTRAMGSAQRFTQLETWTYGLLNAAIMGGSTSVTAWLGMVAAKAAGIADMPVMNWKSLGVIFVSGAAMKFFAYLSQGLPVLVTKEPLMNQHN